MIMVKLYFHNPTFNEKEKELIKYLWEHFLCVGYVPYVFDIHECPEGFATTLVKSEYGIDDAFYVRESNIFFTSNKYLNQHFKGIEVSCSKEEIARFERGSQLLQYLIQKIQEKEKQELLKINNLRN